ncbi:MAG: porin [Rhodobacteraceae bacterium]|nr:porin [Paracoccaceae bacterium]
MAGGATAMDGGGGLSLSGSAGLGLTFTGKAENAAGATTSESKIEFNEFAKVTFTGEGVTDGGLTFGMKVRVRSDSDNEVDDGEVYIGGEGWKVTVGDNDRASDLAFSLGDVGFDGNVGVDNVAEGLADNGAGQARVDVTLGMATIGFSVGQEDIAAVEGRAAVPAISARAAVAPTYQGTNTILFDNGQTGTDRRTTTFTFNTDVPYQTVSATAFVPFVPGTSEGAPSGTELLGVAQRQFYIVGNTVYHVVDAADSWTDPAGDDPAERADATDANGADVVVGTVNDLNGDTDGLGITMGGLSESEITLKSAGSPARAAAPAVDAVMARAADQETHWALGGKVDLGVATIGFGYDSDKAIQASVGGDFGQFGGSVYYAQQKDDTDTKHTSLGAQVDVSAGEATKITAVFARHEGDGMADMDGFGLGVKHDLGGGATVEAGFGKVEDVNKAGVGVVMSF